MMKYEEREREKSSNVKFDVLAQATSSVSISPYSFCQKLCSCSLLWTMMYYFWLLLTCNQSGLYKYLLSTLKFVKAEADPNKCNVLRLTNTALLLICHRSCGGETCGLRDEGRQSLLLAKITFVTIKSHLWAKKRNIVCYRA